MRILNEILHFGLLADQSQIVPVCSTQLKQRKVGQIDIIKNWCYSEFIAPIVDTSISSEMQNELVAWNDQRGDPTARNTRPVSTAAVLPARVIYATILVRVGAVLIETYVISAALSSRLRVKADAQALGSLNDNLIIHVDVVIVGVIALKNPLSRAWYCTLTALGLLQTLFNEGKN